MKPCQMKWAWRGAGGSSTYNSFIYEIHKLTFFCRPGIARALEEFKIAVYGENYDQEEADAVASKRSASEATKKRKANANAAVGSYNWAELADEGKVSVLQLFLVAG